MKNKQIFSLFLLLAAGSLLFLNSCSKISTMNIHKTYGDINFVVHPQASGTIDFEQEVTADLQDMATTNGFDISKIESATINSITLKINDSTSVPVTFDIVDNATCSFYADGATVAEVASDDAVHTSPNQIDFDLKGIDVAQYLKATKFKVKMRIVTNAAITHDVPMNASIECTFKVKPLK